MNEENLLQSAYEVMYGRVCLTVPSHKSKKLSNAVISIKWWLTNGEPFYAYGKHLFYTVKGDEYHIYNPQKLKFSLAEIRSYCTLLHRFQEEEKPKNFEIIGV